MTSPLRWVIGSPSLSTRTESETSPSKAPVGIIMSRALSVNGIGNDAADSRLTATSVPRAVGLSASRRATRKIVSVGATSPLRDGASTIVPLIAALGSTGASGAARRLGARPAAEVAERAAASAAAPRQPNLRPSPECPTACWRRPFSRTTAEREGAERGDDETRGAWARRSGWFAIGRN